MSMGVGSYQDTLMQMHELIGQLEQTRKEHRAAEDLLIEQLRQRLVHLEAIVCHREDEYDRLEERFCALQEEHARCQ
jgi:hypothetical protein